MRARSKSKVYVHFHSVLYLPQVCRIGANTASWQIRIQRLLVLNYHILSSPLSNSTYSIFHYTITDYNDERMLLFTIPFATITVTVIAAIKQFTKHHYTINTLFLMAWVHKTTYFYFQTAAQWLQEAPLQFLHIKQVQ